MVELDLFGWTAGKVVKNLVLLFLSGIYKTWNLDFIYHVCYTSVPLNVAHFCEHGHAIRT
jgi:hypothetical protein